MAIDRPAGLLGQRCYAFFLLFLTTNVGAVLECNTTSKHLGMRGGKIKITQLKASSRTHEDKNVNKARLYKGSAWNPTDADTSPWMQVDLKVLTTVNRIITQGQLLNGIIGYVKTFQVSYGYLESDLRDYKLNGAVKVFSANVDTSNEKSNALFVQARFIRIHPKTWHNTCFLRIELVGCYHECPSPLALGMENKLVRDEMVTGSSKVGNPSHARLNHGSYWAIVIRNSWLQVDFIMIAIVMGVSTQGSASWWVKRYQMSYLYDGSEFRYFEESGKNKTFSGNSDGSSKVTNYFYPPIVARRIRLHPTRWNMFPTRLRVEYLGCYHFCSQPLGMESGAIQDSQLSASSERQMYEVNKARYNNSEGFWRPAAKDIENPWYQIDFKTDATVKVIATQGSPTGPQRMKNFTVMFSSDGKRFEDYLEKGKKKFFSGNKYPSIPPMYTFNPPIVARFFRLCPMRIGEDGPGALQMELYGCYETCSNPARLGVANRTKILDSQFDASSFNDHNLSPRNARLTPPASCKGWRTAHGDSERWIQVDFLRSTKVTAVLTQGRDGANDWITKYVVMYGNDGKNFLGVLNHDGTDQVFLGSATRKKVVRNTIKPVIFARFVRLKALEWGNFPAARLEYEGCYIDYEWEISFPMGMESRLILDAQLSASSSKSSSSAAANARLNTSYPTVSGWIAAEDDSDPWLQVDFIGETTVKAIRIQMVVPSLVTSFNVSYGNNESSLVNCRENGLSQIIHGVDSHSQDVKSYLQPFITARYLRLHPSNHARSCAMKFEFYGHYQGCMETEAILSSHKFVASQLTSSLAYRPSYQSPFVRMNEPSIWIADPRDNDPWIEVDFLAPTKVCDIDSLGRKGGNLYVKTFTVSFSNDGVNYQFYEEDGHRKVFIANLNDRTLTKQRLARTIFSRFIRVHPLTFNSHKSMKLEIYGTDNDTDWFDEYDLGMGNNFISESQITTSSALSWYCDGYRGRLNAIKDGQLDGGWIAGQYDTAPWLQVDFIVNVTLTAMETQGLYNNNSRVTKYILAYGQDPANLNNYTQNGRLKMFSANHENGDTVKQYIFPHCTARYARIQPKAWNGSCAMRLEFYGRYEGKGITKELGMQSGYIRANQITVSSARTRAPAVYSRLNHEYKEGVAEGAWMPAKNDGCWLQVDFLTFTFVNGLITKGHGHSNYYTGTFQLSFAIQESIFIMYKEYGKPKTFQANYDKNTAVQQRLRNPIFARHIRLYPQKKVGTHALKVEFLGFYVVTDWFEAVPLGVNSLIPDHQLTASSTMAYEHRATQGRKSSLKAWRPSEEDNAAWFQIDFTTKATIVTIFTQGTDQDWVENYTLAFSRGNNVWQDYQLNGQIKIFQAHWQNGDPVVNNLYPYIVAHLIRIKLKSCKGECSLRVEVSGRYEACCDDPRPLGLGMVNGRIEDSQISASSQTQPHTTRMARLNSTDHYSGWSPVPGDAEPWLQVDFLQFAKIVQILTQGRGNNPRYYVKKFSVSYSCDGLAFAIYKEYGTKKEFLANRDNKVVAYSRLANPVVLRFIRLHVLEWADYVPALRVEFMGCYLDSKLPPVYYEISSQIVDGQLIASSEQAGNAGSAASAKVGSGGWIAHENDANPWLQVDFLTNVTIFGMVSGDITGATPLTDRVTSFTVAYGYGGEFVNYTQDGSTTKVFFDRYLSTYPAVSHYFYPVIFARYVRMQPLTWIGKCTMEVEFAGRYDCVNPRPLGMENGSIDDGQITASSIINTKRHAIYSRLNNKLLSDDVGGSWKCAKEDAFPWLQVDLFYQAKITGVSTQGHPSKYDYIKTFKISTGNDGKNFASYTESAVVKIFEANVRTVVNQTFAKIIVARFVRIHPLTSHVDRHLRVEIYGSLIVTTSCLYPHAFGLENYVIRDAQLTSSSTKDQTSRAVNARQNLNAAAGIKTGAWIALDTDLQPWLRVDFTANVSLTAVATQGREDSDEWVTSFKLSFSVDSNNYEYYEENDVPKVFQANIDRNSIVKHYVFPEVFTRYVRLHPKTWHEACAMRTEFFGCYEGCADAGPLGFESNFVRSQQFTSSSKFKEMHKWGAYSARLKYRLAWLPQIAVDPSPWLQVDLEQFTKVVALSIQGKKTGVTNAFWTTRFVLSFSNDKLNYEKYKEFGWIKEFNGNFEYDRIIHHRLTRAIFAHVIRVHPKLWKEIPAIRMELYGCYCGCHAPRELGMSDGRIGNYQIWANHGKYGDNGVETARLFSDTGWWTTEEKASLKINLLAPTVLTRIKTQGTFNRNAWLTEVGIGYRHSNTWRYLPKNTANNDSNTVATIDLENVVGRRISIYDFQFGGSGIGLRVGLYGCSEDMDVCASAPCQNGGTCHDYFDGHNSLNCTCANGFTGVFCEAEIFESRALGMEHGQIADDQITSPLKYSDEYRACYGRLNNVLENSRGCWCPKDDDSYAWFQVDFLVDTTVTSVHTQGNPATDVDERVTTFEVSYSLDGVNFAYYKQDGTVKTFNGNTGPDIVATNTFSSPISARFIRIHPNTSTGANKGCLRVEFKGCYAILTCYYPHTLGMESGRILDSQITASSSRNETYAPKRGRLNNQPFVKRGEWMVMPTDFPAYFQVTFHANTTMTMVQIQARTSSVAGVKYFQLTYILPGTDSYRYYKEHVVDNWGNIKNFKASTEPGAVNNYTLTPVIFASAIRVLPRVCTVACALRVEFYGRYDDFDVCQSSPCQNNGSCHDHFDFFNYFTCTCANGYTGNACQTEINECYSYPCLNNGSCDDLINAYNCSCPVDYYGVNCEFEHFYPIENFTLRPIPTAKEFGENISIIWDLDDGSYTSVDVYYNEILCCNVTNLHRIGGQCNCQVTDPSLFDPDGVVDMRVFARNSVSNKTLNFTLEVLKGIQNPVISMLTSFSTFGSGVKGQGQLQNIFPADYPVKFSTSYKDGPATFVQWDFNCEASGKSIESDYKFDKSFPGDVNQHCDITVTLNNSVSTARVHGSIILKESIIFTRLSNDGPVKLNKTITLTILLEKFATETCMWVDLGDNSSLLVFGDASCATKFVVADINPNIVATPPLKFFPRSPTTQEVIVQHIFSKVGSFRVRMNASNKVSKVAEETVAVILALECKNPNITILGMAPNSSNILNATQVYRSVSISLSPELQVDCEKTQETKVTWTVFRFVDDPRLLNTIPRLKVSNLQKAVHHSSIPTNDLLLQPRDLLYGFYEIVARVEMKGLPDVFGVDSFFVEIIQTPWVNAAVLGGSFYTVPYGMTGTLNASASIDPDFLGTDGMEFLWFCRDVDDQDFLLSNFTSEPLLAFPEVPDLDSAPVSQTTDNTTQLIGCFGTGRGRLNSTDLILQLETSTMTEDKSYTISLLVRKTHPEFGLRQHLTNIFFYVAKGEPPAVTMGCYKNCKSKVVHDEKLIVKSSCDERCYGALEFSWKLFVYDDIHIPEPFNLTDLNEISKDELQQMTVNPIDELEMGIKAYSFQPGKKYTLTFRATRVSGVYGELRHTMLINTPPENGNCSIFPFSGLAAQTNFTISCENWIDTDSPLTYEFSYETGGVKVVLFYRTIGPGRSISVTDWLGIGDERDEYRLNVTVLVKDYFHSKSIQVMTVQVYPPPESTLDMGKILGLVSGENNILQQYFDSNKGPKAYSLCSTVGLILNYIALNKTSNNGTGISSEQVRGEVLQSIASANMSIEDTSAMKQVSSTIFTLTKEPDELTPDSQDTALDICNSLTGNLKHLSDKDNGFGEIVTSLGFILGSLGQMNNGSTKETELTPDRVKRTTAIVGNLQDIVADNLVTSEGPVNVETETFSIQGERVQVKGFGQKKNTLKNCDFHPPSANALGMKEVIENPNNTFLQMQPIDIKLAVFNKNPFNWDNTSETITSDVVDIVIDSKMNISSSNFTEEAAITVARDTSQFPKPGSFYMKPSETNSTANTKEYLKYHCLNRSSNYTSMNFEIRPEDIGIHLKVYLKSGGKPDIKSGDFDLSYDLPDLKSCTVPEGTITNSEILHNHNSGQAIHVHLKNCSRDPYTVFVSNQDLNNTGKHCFAVQHIQYQNESSNENSETDSSSRKRRSVSCEVGARRVRRSCVIVPPAPPKPTYKPPIKILVADNLGFDGKFFFPNQTPNYNSTMFESSCMHWDVKNETWTGEGCRVAVGTNKESILCYCDHLTSFGSDLLVAPNPIDFDSVFQNFGSLAENVAVLALISTILGLYIIGVIWARRADKRDLLMLGPTILPNPQGNYHYLISTYTGSRQSAGTTARVVFKMAGDDGETEPVRLRDRHRPCFQRGQENSFIVSYPKGVGDLTYLQIWHDNSGSSPSWYLSRMSVKDLQTGETWPLFCENWLAVESEDGKVCRLLSVANEQEMVNFGHLFSARAIKGLADGHIWFSIVSRPPTSNFTRVQRLSCALCLLCCTMITSAMFYNMGGQGPSPFAVNIGSLIIDLKPFVIGLQSSIIIIPVNVLLVQIFRNLRPKDKSRGKEHKTGGNESEENSGASKGKLPHWFIFIAYAICYLASGASIFFTLLYSIQWGKETSTEWVIAMVTSFLQSALLLQPVKVVLMAIIFAVLIRKPADTEDESNTIELVNIPPKDKVDKEIPAQVKKKTKKYYSPPDAESLKVARVKRLKEIKTNAAICEIIAFFFFLILLMDVANYHRDTNSFLMTKTLHETFDEVDAFSIDLSAVSDTDSLWMWSRETLIPGLYATELYNGKKIKEGWIANLEDYLVGVPRIRLIRVEEDSCPISNYFEGKISHCYDGYSTSIEEDGTYNVGWESLNSDSTRKRRDASEDVSIPWTEIEWTAIVSNVSNTSNDDGSKTRSKRALDPIMGGSSGRKRRKKKRLMSSSSPKIYTINDNAILPNGMILSCLERWRHRTMLELRGFPNWGTISWYSGGGYATNLGYDQVTAYTVVSDLHSNGWIDVQSRAVLVEFTVYNANTNLFGIVTIFVEFLPSSGAITKSDFQASRFYLQLSGGQTLAHVLVIFFMLYFLFRESKLVYKQRLSYFKGFWNWIETVLVISQFLLIVLFLARLYEVDRNLLQLRENPKDYVGFQYAGQADAFMTFILGVLVFFYTIRFLRILRFNKNFLVVGKTLSRISSPILSFCVPFIFAFLAFGLFAYTVFSSELEDYSSFTRTMVTQLAMTLGDFDFEALFMVNPVLATFYFFSFIGLNVMVLTNMFIAIINDSYAEIQEETAEVENEFEIVDYVVDKLTSGVYSKIKRGKVAPLKNKTRTNTKKKVKNSPKRLFLDDNVDLDTRVSRLDNLLNAMDKSLEDEERMSEQFLAVPRENRDIFFRVLCLMEENNTYYESEDDMEDWSDLSDDSLY